MKWHIQLDTSHLNSHRFYNIIIFPIFDAFRMLQPNQLKSPWQWCDCLGSFGHSLIRGSVSLRRLACQV